MAQGGETALLLDFDDSVVFFVVEAILIAVATLFLLMWKSSQGAAPALLVAENGSDSGGAGETETGSRH
jgi:hypothetical protein